MSLALVSPKLSAVAPITITDAFQIDSEEKPRILIVDDSRLVRSVFFNTLSVHYDCMSADSYESAVECLRMFEFDVVIADVIMPGMSGIELLRKVVEKYPDTTVIIVSGVDRPQRALDALRLGAFDYIIKPCELPVLEVTVERALEHRRLLKNAKKAMDDLEVRNIELTLEKTERQRLQMQIIQNEKMAALGQIAAGIAHELNNPVAFVHGNLDLLNQTAAALIRMLRFYESVELPPEIVSKATEIKNEICYLSTLDDLDGIIRDCRDGTERIRDIVQNLRTFSRLDEAEFKKADVNAGIDSTIRLLSQYFKNGNISLVRNYGELPEIDAFGSQLNQVWMNFLVNAAQSIGNKNGEIRIKTFHEDGQIGVTITDSGEGIAKQHLNRIFDPFYTTKAVGEGTGLGLSICFGIVERHNGTIFVDSKLGKGTAFTVKLPVQFDIVPAAAETGIEKFELIRIPQESSFHEIQNAYSG